MTDYFNMLFGMVDELIDDYAFSNIPMTELNDEPTIIDVDYVDVTNESQNLLPSMISTEILTIRNIEN